MAETRAEDREVQMGFRMSVAQRARLKAEAAELGVSAQVLFERKMLHVEDAAVRSAGPIVRDPELDLGISPRRPRSREVLPLTG